MIIIDTDLDPAREIIIAQGMAEIIGDSPEVLSVTVYTEVDLIEGKKVWHSD